MKRQVAILGPTPEFVRWSVPFDCSMRSELPTGSIDAAEKRLLAIQATGQAIRDGHVFGDVAAGLIDGEAKGFRISEVLRIDGGLDQVSKQCGNCKANVTDHQQQRAALAGCHGWFPAILSVLNSPFDIRQAIESCVTANPHLRHPELCWTQPIWYGIWEKKTLTSPDIQWLSQLISAVLKSNNEKLTESSALQNFAHVLQGCVNGGLDMDVELVPAGRSDGIRWTLLPHCPRCRAHYEPKQNSCAVCKKSGRGHPEIHRKVRGQRPWIPLCVVLGPKKAADFQEKHQLKEIKTGTTDFYRPK